MKKILFICNHLQYSDGAAISLRNLVNGICDYYDVYILNLYTYQKDFVSSISPKVTIYKIFGFYIKGLRSFTNKILLNLILKHKVFTAQNYDYIVSYQYGTPSLLINNIVKKNKKTKYIGFIHGFKREQIDLYSNLDAIVSISNEGKKLANEMLPNYKGTLVHINNIYSVEDIIAKSKETPDDLLEILNKGKVVYCLVSRLSEEKGIDRFIYSFKKFSDHNQKALGIIIGNGPLREKLIQLINEINANDCIKMLGEKENPYPYISNCDFFCCPSRSEGLCTSCVEAAILKKPILSTDVSGAREIICDPNIGVIVENCDNVESFYKGLCKITTMNINDSNKERAKTKWNSADTINKYIEFFDNL